MAHETYIAVEADVNGMRMKNAGSLKNGLDKHEEQLGPKRQGACQKIKKKTIAIGFISILLLGSVIGNIIQAEEIKKLQAILTPVTKKLQATPSPSDGCIHGWSRHGDQCYFFSNEEQSWELCHSICSSYNASLVTLYSEEERALLKSRGGECWIDLQRKKADQPWKWQNRSIVTEFEVKGTGFCAYMNGDTVSSTTCDNIRHCICRKRVDAALRES